MSYINIKISSNAGLEPIYLGDYASIAIVNADYIRTNFTLRPIKLGGVLKDGTILIRNGVYINDFTKVFKEYTYSSEILNPSKRYTTTEEVFPVYIELNDKIGIVLMPFFDADILLEDNKEVGY